MKNRFLQEKKVQLLVLENANNFPNVALNGQKWPPIDSKFHVDIENVVCWRKSFYEKSNMVSYLYVVFHRMV